MVLEGQVIDSVLTDSVIRVQDSLSYGDALFQATMSYKPQPPFDTITQFVALVRGTPLSGGMMDFEFMSGILAYTVMFLIFMAWIRLRGYGFISSVFMYFFTKKRGAALLPERIRQNVFFIFLSLCLSYSCVAILIAFLTSDPFSYSIALLCFLALFGYHLFLVCMVALFGWTFNERHCASDMILNIRVWGIVFGLSISPFVLMLFYIQSSAINPLLYVIASILLILLIFRFIRLIKILYGYRVSILYIILYLCGLEILPILVLYKLLQ